MDRSARSVSQPRGKRDSSVSSAYGGAGGTKITITKHTNFSVFTLDWEIHSVLKSLPKKYHLKANFASDSLEKETFLGNFQTLWNFFNTWTGAHSNSGVRARQEKSSVCPSE